jgi:hypothetical protein
MLEAQRAELIPKIRVLKAIKVLEIHLLQVSFKTKIRKYKTR